ncbi:hypothetical protein [Rhodopseudomonas pseudopalustris]|uniref:Uncharacterized protein n=1 Tax=Rhodopseudomonas pseudopalustris TaxID=1513892 RepID=A0A1H8X927_9BRAD|nr:hypothetical protein [Rhodopseudomonas pseudopalustris]SEP36223.1 hypothetical protein SAMN05444123_11769 [Rhodopseudomonas pseudopalustris]
MVVLDLLLDFVGYGTSRVLVPLLSFGNIRVQAVKSPGQMFNWSGFKRLPDDTYLCSSDLAGWIGLSVWVVGLIAIFAAI